MSNNKIKYLLGIDGGGTKTEFLLCDLNGNEIKRIFLGASNPVSSDIEKTFEILNNGILSICNGIDISEISVFAGIAGIKSGNRQNLINEFLSHFGFASYDCASDIDLALEIALKDENGTAVIMGTGIVAYSRSDGNLYRCGGRGYLIDKGGSGFHYGSDALNCAFEYIDGTGGSETVLKLVETKLGKKIEESVTEIYSGGAAYIASFAPVIFEAYKLGDSAAYEIIEHNVSETVKIINGARKKLNKHDNKIIICGGLCKQKEIFYPFFMKHFDDKTTLIFLDEPMVNGAVSLAKRSSKIC